MTIYHYKAAPLERSVGAVDGASVVAGELAAESPAALRASLRRIGLQVIDARPARRVIALPQLVMECATPITGALRSHMRSRRVRAKAELFDSLSTMLDAGLPIVEAVSTLASSRSHSATRTMLIELREQLTDGAALDAAMEQHPWWYEPAEIAMVRAVRASGELPSVLRALADRHERSGALSAKLLAALTYPAVVSCVGLGVVIFLSIKTLPDLVGILVDAGIEPPRLTTVIIAIGQAMARYGLLAGLLGMLAVAGVIGLASRLDRRGWRAPVHLRRLIPGAARRTLTARAWSNLAELVATGVPLVEALKITAPTVGGGVWGVGVLGGSLSGLLSQAASEIERGSSFADALDDPIWFDDECRRLIAIGESAGELPDILQRLADRTHRSASRAIDRLASLLEPAVILALATAIGFVVIGAVLPILKLQEIIG